MQLNVHVMGPLWNYQSRRVETDAFDQRSIVGARCRGGGGSLKVCLLSGRAEGKGGRMRKRRDGNRGWRRGKSRRGGGGGNPTNCLVFTDHWKGNGFLKRLPVYERSHAKYLICHRCPFFFLYGVTAQAGDVMQQLPQSANGVSRLSQAASDAKGGAVKVNRLDTRGL